MGNGRTDIAIVDRQVTVTAIHGGTGAGTRLELAAAALVVLSVCGVAHAMGPHCQSDAELAACPVIVVAQWDRTTVRPAPDGGSFAFQTELNVLRTIRGPIGPGKHDVFLGYGLVCYPNVTSQPTWAFPSPDVDVDDVTKPNIWFLDRQLTFERGPPRAAWAMISIATPLPVSALLPAVLAVRREKPLPAAGAALIVGLSCAAVDVACERIWSPLRLFGPRAIQSLRLEQYYSALGARRPASHLTELLTSDDAEVVRRSLRYLGGWTNPWFYGPFFWPASAPWRTREAPGEPQWDQAVAVKAAMPTMPLELRPLAAGVYAELAGADGIEYLRELLDDKDSAVRGMAAVSLARRRDGPSMPRMQGALAELAPSTDPQGAGIACAAADAMGAWGDGRLAPALIQFLQNGTFICSYDDEPPIPAVRARNALHAATGHWFPFSVEASGDAWRQVESIPEKAARQRELQRILSGTRYPLRAELIGSPRPAHQRSYGPPSSDNLTVTLTVMNISSRALMITRYPRGVEWHGPHGRGWMRPIPPSGYVDVGAYATLEPEQRIEFNVEVSDSLLLAHSTTRQLNLEYTKGKEHAQAAALWWMGHVPVEFGPLWERDRKIEKVEERSPNGSFETVRPTVYGQTCDQWECFDECGTTREVEAPPGPRDPALSPATTGK